MNERRYSKRLRSTLGRSSGERNHPRSDDSSDDIDEIEKNKKRKMVRRIRYCDECRFLSLQIFMFRGMYRMSSAKLELTI